jgi:hypothetical protein
MLNASFAIAKPAPPDKALHLVLHLSFQSGMLVFWRLNGPLGRLHQ